MPISNQRKIVNSIIAAVLCIFVFKFAYAIGQIGEIDTTGVPPTSYTILVGIISLAIFAWCLNKIWRGKKTS